MLNFQVLVNIPAVAIRKKIQNPRIIDTLLSINSVKCNLYIDLTIDFEIAFAGVLVLLENKNLVFRGTSTEKGYDPLPFATGTCNCQIKALNQAYQIVLYNRWIQEKIQKRKSRLKILSREKKKEFSNF